MNQVYALAGLSCILASGCVGRPQKSHSDTTWKFGRIDRFEITDSYALANSESIVVTDAEQVRTLSEGYRDLEWTPYLATVPNEFDRYKLVGFRGDEKLIRLYFGPRGVFTEGYGERVAKFTGEARTLFDRLIATLRVDEASDTVGTERSVPLAR